MIKNTFRHVPGIATRTEQLLWCEGILSWEEALDREELPLREKTRIELYHSIEDSFHRLDDGDSRYFADKLPASEQWRLFREFRRDMAYIDIETNGRGIDAGGYITTIALYNGRSTHHYVHGENLQEFKDDIFNYGVLVTYNGRCFDLPYIERYFNIELPHAHIDLRYPLNTAGYSGGLKGCERQAGLDRGELDGVDGFFAVHLWNDFYGNGNGRALETLLAYNTLDVVNLEALMVIAYNALLEETPFFDTHTIPAPILPAPSYKPDMETIERIRREMSLLWRY